MKTLEKSTIGRGARPQAPSCSRRAVGGNGPYLLACLLFAASLAIGTETPLNAAKPETASYCAAEKPVVKKDACCEAMEGTPFSQDSIYQLDARFTNDAGQPFQLAALRDRPVVLTMFFASCGYACPLTVTDMLSIRGQLPAGIRAKAQFVLVSFDVARDTPAALRTYREQRALDSQWTLLHGDSDAVKELAALLGVKFKEETDGSFSHSNVITILNAEGEIVHQHFGLQMAIDDASKALLTAAK